MIIKGLELLSGGGIVNPSREYCDRCGKEMCVTIKSEKPSSRYDRYTGQCRENVLVAYYSCGSPRFWTHTLYTRLWNPDKCTWEPYLRL
jgi:hypothetical protein